MAAARVLAVVAHPDDEVLGVGGTLLRHVSEGDEVRVLIVCSQLDPELRLNAGRIEAATAVAREAGWSITFGWQPTLNLDIAKVTALLGTIEADVVYTHHLDLHRDHRTIHEAVKVASRPFASDVRALRTFYTPSASEWGDAFTPNHYVGIDPARKTALLAHYGPELRPSPHPRSAAVVEAHALFWGSHAGLPAAEPFHTLWERR